MPTSPLSNGRPKRPRVVKAHDVFGISKAFRPEPLAADEMEEFYAESLDRQRGNDLLRGIKDDLLETAEQGFFFKGVLYGNRGTGKSTELNRLMDDPRVKSRFVIIQVDALAELNPQSFSVADVMLLVFANLIECCMEKCRELKRGFHEAWTMMDDLQKTLAPFFPELQNKEQFATTAGGSGEIGLLRFVKLAIRVEGQRKIDSIAERERLAELTDALERQLAAARNHLPEYELLVVGENFDKEQIPQALLQDTFVQYASVLRKLSLHLLFTLPVPFVYSFGQQLAFRRQNWYPVYDIPVFTEEHAPHTAGLAALMELLEKRADLNAVFADDAVALLIRASGGDLYRLFAIAVNAGRRARYRKEDHPETESTVLRKDVESAAREQLGIFRNELGTAPAEPNDAPWPEKLKKLRSVYENNPAAEVPDPVLYQLVRRQAVLFFNGRGRYGLHPMAVEILREQLMGDSSFRYRGGGVF